MFDQVTASASELSVRPDRSLRANNVARRLGVTDRDVRYLAATGKLRGFKIGKLWFFLETDVIKYQASHAGIRRQHVH